MGGFPVGCGRVSDRLKINSRGRHRGMFRGNGSCRGWGRVGLCVGVGFGVGLGVCVRVGVWVWLQEV